MNQERPYAKGEPKDRDQDRSATGGSPGSGTMGSGVSGSAGDDDTYWRDNYQSRPYIDAAYGYDDYGPAYRYGADSYANHGGRDFDDVESDLGAGWDRAKSGSRLTWERAKAAVRDAWDRLAHPGGHKASRDSGGTMR
jgi:hypothetical protein